MVRKFFKWFGKLRKKTRLTALAVILVHLLSVRPLAQPTSQQVQQAELRAQITNAIDMQRWDVLRDLVNEAEKNAAHLSADELHQLNALVRRQTDDLGNPVQRLFTLQDALQTWKSNDIPNFMADFAVLVKTSLHYVPSAEYITRSKGGILQKTIQHGPIVDVYNFETWIEKTKEIQSQTTDWVENGLLPICESGLDVNHAINFISALIDHMQPWIVAPTRMGVGVDGINIVDGKQFTIVYNMSYSDVTKEATQELVNKLTDLLNELIVAQQAT